MEAYAMAGHLIRRLNQSSTQIFVMRAREAGIDITPVQFAALDALRARPGIDQASLAASIAYDQATIGGVVDRLVAKGLVTRAVSARDRRAHEVQLTAMGEAAFEALLPVVRASQDEILGRLTRQERARFMALARKAIGSDAAIDGR
jgi:DNA-binding MarR family transcriptional regulator